MQALTTAEEFVGNGATIEADAQKLFIEHRQQIYVETDRMFAALMAFQWLAGIVVACTLSPRTWSGDVSSVHPHVWAAVLLGGIIGVLPIYLGIFRSGLPITRYVIAVGQMLSSALLIHLCGGRIEAHFHVFGSLAFLSFYREWRIMVVATAVVATDHFVRGIYFPASVFGVLAVSHWRWLEHVGWVVFEDIFLIHGCLKNVREMHKIADQRAQLEITNTTIKRAHSELQIAKEAAEAANQVRGVVFDTALDAIVTIDSRGAITAWNLQAETMFRWDRTEVIGKRLDQTIIPDPYWDAHRCEIERFLHTGDGPLLTKVTETLAIRRDGREFPVEVAITPAWSGSECNFTAFIRDITVRKQAEAELRHAKDVAETACRVKSEFLATMSHEIRTPLNGVIGMSGLLLDTALDERQRRFAELIQASGTSLSELINDILDFSKIEARKLEIESVDFHLYSMVENVAETMSMKATQKGLNLTCLITPDVPRRVKGDSERVKQILLNLVNNAIKFTEAGSVSARLSVDDQSQEHMIVRFSIVDTGIGIPADRMDRLFKSFSQVDSSTTRTYGGSGLGLAISKQLAELMGGKVGVESAVGRGSTFWFTVKFGHGSPLDEPVVPIVSSIPSRTAIRPSIMAQRARILLAEDNRVNQIVASEVLAKHGYAYDIVGDGEKAVAAVSTGKYDLVLMDCSMPELDGFEATMRIRREEQANPAKPRRHVPIVALTANAINGDRERCLQAGMDDYVSKPFDPKRLIEAIQTLLAKFDSESPILPVSETAAVTAVVAPTAGCDDAPPLLIDALLERCMGNTETVSLILNEFEHQAAADLAEIKKFVGSGDCKGLARVAHALKGASGILTADALAGIALKLERMGRAGILAEEHQLLTQLSDEVGRCIGYLPTARAAIAKRVEV